MGKIEVQLPSNVRCKLTRGGMAYYWEVPTKDRKTGCKLANEALGLDVGPAITRAKLLNDALRETRQGATDTAQPGTLKWLGQWFLKHPKVIRLETGTQENYASALTLICSQPTKVGTWADLPIKAFRPRHADHLYTLIQWVEETDANGQPVKRRRLRTANLCMQIARRMWKLALRAELVHGDNPFVAMELEETDGEGAAVPATWAELNAFVAKADELGRTAMGTAALIAWHWLQRQTDIIGTLTWTHYVPGQMVRIKHSKTNKIVAMPLRDGDGLLFPDLEARLEAAQRLGTLIVMPGATPFRADTFRHDAREVADKAGLPHLSFSSFRKGGFTELGDAEATDQEMMASGGHKTRQMLTVYSKQTVRQAASAARKRRLWRQIDETNGVQSSEQPSKVGSE